MPKFNVMVSRTTTIEQSVEIEVSAKDADAAQDKASSQIEDAMKKDKIDEAFDWQESGNDDEFDYEVEEA